MKFAVPLHGQWMGRFNGGLSGTCLFDIEQVSPEKCAVSGYIRTELTPHPVDTQLYFDIDATGASQTISVVPQPIDIVSRKPVYWPSIASIYPGVSFPTSVDITLTAENNLLSAVWTLDSGEVCKALAVKSSAAATSEITSETMTWKDFREAIIQIPHRHFIYRGQAAPFRLRTTFHRSGRNHLARFFAEDIKELHRYLTARSRHVFDLNIPDDNGAFLALSQHHGYPTPLLDWTYSPFIAAFFAFESVSTQRSASNSEKVRVFLFDAKAWKQTFSQFSNLLYVGPHLSIAEFLAIENERLLPQQSVSTVTNIDDIEAYISFLEARSERKFLRAIDIQCSEKSEAMRDLAMMGITRGALFPGFDGACAELRERFFPD